MKKPEVIQSDEHILLASDLLDQIVQVNKLIQILIHFYDFWIYLTPQLQFPEAMACFVRACLDRVRRPSQGVIDARSHLDTTLAGSW